jgi:hypothetical protein
VPFQKHTVKTSGIFNIIFRLETRNHVKKFIATHYFFEGDGSIATLTGKEIQNNIPGNEEAYLHTAQTVQP